MSLCQHDNAQHSLNLKKYRLAILKTPCSFSIILYSIEKIKGRLYILLIFNELIIRSNILQIDMGNKMRMVLSKIMELVSQYFCFLAMWLKTESTSTSPNRFNRLNPQGGILCKRTFIAMKRCQVQRYFRHLLHQCAI
jgi:hypothetical protein